MPAAVVPQQPPDHAHAVALYELPECLCERLGLLREDRLAVGALQGQARIGNAGHRYRAELPEEADRVPRPAGRSSS